jgi:hypothetical protein
VSRFIQIVAAATYSQITHAGGERDGYEHHVELHALDLNGRVWRFEGKTWVPLPMDREKRTDGDS